MATFTINIPNDKITALLDAFAMQYNYQEQIETETGEMVPNPVSKAQFAKNIVTSFIKEVYIAGQVKSLEEQRIAAINTAKTDIATVETI